VGRGGRSAPAHQLSRANPELDALCGPCNNNTGSWCYRLYLSIFDRDVARQVGRYTAFRGIGTPSPHAFDATELSYPPYTHVLTVNEQPEEDKLGDITELTRYGDADQVDEVVLELAVNWALLPDPL
jgi:hypothetical protein